MRTKTILFPNQQALCVFPDQRSNLAQAIHELRLQDNQPVMVLIGGGIDQEQATVTRQAIQILAKLAEDMNALVVCGGTDMGVMAEIGQARQRNGYKFSLLGIAPEALVAWPGGPRNTKFLWWGKQRWQLEPHYSHFMLVPGNRFGDESPWIVDTASLLSQGHQSVTILINGGEVSRKDIELSLEKGRLVVALSGTGRLADELAGRPGRSELITIVPADDSRRIINVVQAALSVNERNLLIHFLRSTSLSYKEMDLV